MNLFQKIKMRKQINKSLKESGFNRKEFKQSMKEHINRELDINEILAKDYPDNVVEDAYEYCMRKCNWDPSTLEDSNVRAFLLCVLFEGEVANGGISQFLSNSSGDMSEETALAMEKIDESVAGIIREAIQCFPNGQAPTDREERNEQMDRFDEETVKRLEKLDQTAWGLDISKNCYDFLQEHKTEFLNF